MIFTIKSTKNDYQASLEVKENVYTLKKGSTVSKTISKHFKSFQTVEKRRQSAGITPENRQIKEDINFSSSSVAGEFVSGSSCNGPSTWKTNDGVTLKQWMEERK